MSDVQDSVDSLIDCIVKRYDHDRIIRGSMIVIAGLLPFIMIFITSILISEKYDETDYLGLFQGAFAMIFIKCIIIVYLALFMHRGMLEHSKRDVI